MRRAELGPCARGRLPRALAERVAASSMNPAEFDLYAGRNRPRALAELR